MSNNAFGRIYRVVKTIYENLVTILFATIEVVVVLQILARFSSEVSIPWTEELARMLMVFNTTLGVVCVSRRGEHLGAYFLRDISNGRVKGVIYLLGSLCTLGFMICIVIGAITMCATVGAQPATTTMIWITRGMIYGVLILSASLMAIYAVRDVIHSIEVILGKREITRRGMSSPSPEED